MTLKTWIVAGMALVSLSACALGTEDAPITDGPADAAATPATSVRLVDRDVEAPEVFQTTDKALWDGRPSLGGVWVASPNATNPERVIMRNAANGKFVIGGLFQRDASLPGPKLQLSSDAADALGLLAGEPAEISVTALRREEAAAPQPDATKPLLDSNEAVGTPAPDVAATAAAAIDAATAATPPTTKPTPKPATPAAEPTAQKPAAETPAPAKPASEKPASGKPAPEEPAAQMPLTQPTAAQRAASQAAAKASAAAVSSGALIQIGIFSVEANAKRASDLLAKAGISATTTPETSHGKMMWSVTTRGDTALLAKIKAAGFTDAYVMHR